MTATQDLRAEIVALRDRIEQLLAFGANKHEYGERAAKLLNDTVTLLRAALTRLDHLERERGN